MLSRLFSALQLARIALVFTAISNIWLIVFISDRKPSWSGPLTHDLPLPQWLGCTAAVAVGLYVFGMVLNDVLDVNRDKVFAPDRPITSGKISIPTAMVMATTALLISIVASLPLGWLSVMLCVACAALIIFYNALAKHIPGIGLVTLGLIRGVHMMIANPMLIFCWPVWLTLSHVIGISATSYRLEGKRPPLAGPHIWLITAGWAFTTLGLFAWMNRQPIDAGGVMLWATPLISAGIFLAVALRHRDRASSERAAGGNIMRTGLLWLIAYDTAWMIGMEHWQGALVLGCLIPSAMGAMSLMRHLKAAISDHGAFIRDDTDAHPS